MEATRRIVAAVLVSLGSACATSSPESIPPLPETPRCRRGPVDNYLAERWQHCWFDAAHGRWRTLGHEFHYDVLVVDVEAASLDDAEDIIRRFIELHRGRFNDFTIYVHQEPASRPGPIRRIHWPGESGEFDILNFTGVRGQ